MADPTIQKTRTDSNEERSIGAIDFILGLDQAKLEQSSPLNRLRTTSAAKDDVLLAKAEPAANDFAANAAEQRPAGLSLYDMFIITRTEGEKVDLSISPNSLTVEAIKQFVKDNPDIGQMVLSTNGKTVNQFIKSYDPDKHGPAMQYFDSATLYRPSPSLTIENNNDPLWDPALDKYRRSSGYGPRDLFGHRYHKGVDFLTPRGTSIRAAGNAEVAFAGKANGFGYATILAHGNDVFTLYGHTARPHLHRGQDIAKGQKFLVAGNTGRTTGAHTHMEVLIASNGHVYSIDPDLVSKGLVNLRTREGREEAIQLNADIKHLPVEATRSKMAGRIPRAASPELSLG